ncbi:MAG TPA: hypothetical protein VHP30_13435 [Ignavibacteriales bacterium]|nr:hypothetical protein [Ignavibacteriales bacterium]
MAISCPAPCVAQLRVSREYVYGTKIPAADAAITKTAVSRDSVNLIVPLELLSISFFSPR